MNSQGSEKLQKFLNNYGNFVGQCSNNQGGLDHLIKDFTNSVPNPPQSQSQNEQIQQIYNKAIKLTKQSATDFVTKLRSLKEQKLQDLLLYTEQLNATLNCEYQKEINRAIEIGIYNKSNQN